ncbi:DeoR family transcriptional regulator [Sporocytophaga myxococcoides]|uniref:DeoR family transcriptional regulator n=2 Tax=Sporocytophaga myxococcoides TaxID=153721 RepID=A0A098LLE4_9BACT|nr:DeoR family transcriptional regulator [Sporocytophaga myxococcoides]
MNSTFCKSYSPRFQRGFPRIAIVSLLLSFEFNTLQNVGLLNSNDKPIQNSTTNRKSPPTILRMQDNDTKRLSRLTAILTQLQTKRLLTATALADKFAVSVRTIYRDIRALEQAGVPIITEEGKGYKLMEGYRVPPVMFTEAQANALIIAEQLVLKNKDASFIKDYTEAVDKIKSVLNYSIKVKADLLSERTRFDQNINRERNSNNLSDLQFALTNYFLTKIEYANEQNQTSTRHIEPFALLSTENWLLIAYCRLRQEFRYFRLDRIKKLDILPDKFDPHRMTLQEFFDKYH